MHIHHRAGQQPFGDLYQRSSFRKIDDGGSVPGAHTRRDDPVFAGLQPGVASAVKQAMRHSGLQSLVRTLNFSTLVRPVSPNTRTTY